jgi:TolC family type I secretion outer membrane protein
LGSAIPAGTMAQSLEDALVAAYGSNPTLQAARAQLRATDEFVPQALSNYRPIVTVDGDVGVGWADRKDDRSGDDAGAPRSAGLNVSQPIYRGGRTVAQTRQAENLVLADRARLMAVEQDVLLSAVVSYVDVVQNQSIVDLQKNNEKVIGTQLKQTEDRFEVGEVTLTDVSQAVSRLARATADRVQAEGNLVSSRAVYREIIGELPGTLKLPPVPKGLPTSEQEAVGQSENNPNVALTLYAERAAQHATDLVFGELLPTVSVDGEVRTEADTAFDESQTNSAALIARVVIPLYQAGAVESRVREAKQRAGQRRQEIDEARRNAAQGATTAWQALETARAEIEAFTREVEATERALEGVEQEQQVGVRTVLDVLDAQQEVRDARVNLVQVRRDEIVAAYQVLAAVGRLTARDLELSVEYYDAERHYRDVRDKWWGLSAPPE